MAFTFTSHGTNYSGIRIGVSEESGADAEFAAVEFTVEETARLAFELLDHVRQKGYRFVPEVVA